MQKPKRSIVAHFTEDGAVLVECRRENGTVEEFRAIGSHEKPSITIGDEGLLSSEEDTTNA